MKMSLDDVWNEACAIMDISLEREEFEENVVALAERIWPKATFKLLSNGDYEVEGL